MSLQVGAVCGAAAEAVTRDLGFDCHDVRSVVSLNSPAGLAGWTQPVIELVVIAGAVFALVHAVRRRRDGDPTNLALWFGSLVYLAVVEPPLYFPEWFGLDDIYGFIFAHNIFTVQFMWDRLPLYIVAFYPAITALAYEVVRSLGGFAQRGALAGALGVAFVAQVFYEPFDHLGPQLRWWAWNGDNAEVNQPMLASVPMNSMLLFASVSLAFLTYLIVRLAKLPTAARALVAGVLTPLGMVVAGLPSGLFRGRPEAQAWVLGVELAAVWLVGGWLLVRGARRGEASEPVSRFARTYPAIFLAALALLWVTALPAFLAAHDGVTADGAPVGSGSYVLACFVAASAILVALYRRPGWTASLIRPR